MCMRGYARPQAQCLLTKSLTGEKLVFSWNQLGEALGCRWLSSYMQKLAQKATNYRKMVGFSYGFDSKL